ncbi:MAG: TonB family protein [Methylophilus sp.]|uniref:TonB family protein n=1 Tax=Methylophilus sp. TaxID=29541 RepID=UPI003FA10500
MKKVLIVQILLMWAGFCHAADEVKDVWLSDEKGCKSYTRFKQPLNSIEWAGECKDGYLDGAGVLKVFEDGIHKATYSGHFVEGKLQGKGVAEFFNSRLAGERVEAEFFNNTPHGLGVYSYPDGSRFEGRFEKGCPQTGVTTWANGVSYEGEYKKCRVPDEVFKAAVITIKQKTVYPPTLDSYGSQGVVLVNVDISENDQLKGVEVLQSNHPLFEQAAIRSLKDATVKAVQVKDKPIPARVTQPFTYAIPRFRNKPDSYKTYPDKANPAEPEILQYDYPPADKVVAPLVYPLDLLKKNVRGTATVAVVIDPTGSPKQLKVIESSEPAFGESLKAMLASSTFFPARKNKQFSWSAFNIKRIFTQYGTHDIAINEHGQRILDELKDAQPNIAPVKTLDHAPKPFYTPPPAYPLELVDKGVTGTVLVEFYIDKEGSVQFPHTLKTNNEELAWLALTAVARWQFYPPTVKGKPVDTVVTVPVAFNLNN